MNIIKKIEKNKKKIKLIVKYIKEIGKIIYILKNMKKKGINK